MNQIRLALALAIALLFLATCTQATLTPTPSTPPPTAEEVLAKASDAMADVESFRFTGELVVNTDEGVQEVRLSGEWAAPDRSRMRFERLGSGAGHNQEVISVGGQVFASDSDYKDGAWTKQRAIPPGQALAPGKFLADAGLEDLQMVENEAANGVPAFHITGTSTSEIAEGVPASVSTYDLYIGAASSSRSRLASAKEDMLLRRLVIETDFSGLAESAPSSEDYVPISQRVTYDFYDYNEPVTIQLPELGEG